MAAPGVDYGAAFRAGPSPMLVLSPELIMLDANDAYQAVSGRTREQLLGRRLFDVFPDNPRHPDAGGPSALRASLDRVLETRERDSMALQQYDVEDLGHPGEYAERYWSTVNTPVLDGAGEVAFILHRVEEVTALVRQLRGAPPEGPLSPADRMAADLLARSEELALLNEDLRRAHAREREVALALQRALLPAVPATYRPSAAVRYRPAATALNVCGDWYDLVDLDRRSSAVAVGDVVGHGLEAAGVMGQLHSALSAAVRATGRPARALETLALFAASVEGALSTTVVQIVVDRRMHTIRYSCAGHPPPVLVQADGTAELLDAATDPPLGAWDESLPRSEAEAHYRPGATLVLYTDGLVERRGEDIDAGLGRLVDSVTRHRRLEPEQLADALLTDLGADDGQSADDIAVVVLRL
ncbi:PP2C family protein-serine/threonine phosphatase [Kitasatospora sp. NBC_01539]|uniref:PP2C family protein-serine/threonine phosphatase n=1 Tax=Kitasatospora sp. NBC_01539 TaxID=2903577 RepID=UPI003860107F